MKIANSKEQLLFDVDVGSPRILVIENPVVFAEVIYDLNRQCNGEEGNFVFSENNVSLVPSRTTMLITDYFTLDLNQKKIQNFLYKKLANAGSELDHDKSTFTSIGINLLDKVIDKSIFDHVIYDIEISWNTIFKCFNIRIEDEDISISEKIIDFIRICRELLDIQLLITVNLKSYLSNTSLVEVYKMANYLGLKLLLLESHEGDTLPDERCTIIDKDMCVIIKDI